jgi:hypothetical protein
MFDLSLNYSTANKSHACQIFFCMAVANHQGSFHYHILFALYRVARLFDDEDETKVFFLRFYIQTSEWSVMECSFYSLPTHPKISLSVMKMSKLTNASDAC